MENTQSLLKDELWERVQPLLPEIPVSPEGGRPRASDRACFEGIVWVLRSGARWRDLPEHFPSPTTCWRRHRDWTLAGVWKTVWGLTLVELAEKSKLQSAELFLDATFVAAKKGAMRSVRPSVVRG